MLDNIKVTLSDLQAVFPDIDSYRDPEQEDFKTEIDESKRDLYAKIKEIESTTGYSNADLDTRLESVKDYPLEQYLKRKISVITCITILRQNRLYEDMDVLIQLNNNIPLKYYVDIDDSGDVSTSEERKINYVGFRRG